MVVSLMGAPSTAMKLIRWILDALRKSGRMTKVQTGKVTFGHFSEAVRRI